MGAEVAGTEVAAVVALGGGTGLGAVEAGGGVADLKYGYTVEYAGKV
jgi:hypothetical protein